MKNKRTRITIIASFVLVTVGLGIWNYGKKSRILYKEFPAKRDDLVVSILSTGTVQPENRLEIKAPIAGRIDEVYVSEGAKVKRGQLLARMSSTERAALLDSARSNGAKEYRYWQGIYNSTPILAPLPGTIILRNVEPGQTITTNDAILALSDRLTVKAQVDETDIAKIKLHQKAEIVLDAYPDQSLSATVDQIAFEAKTVNNVTTYIVDVLPQNTPDFMRSGMTANVKFAQEAKEKVVLIPAESIFLSNGKSKVLVKTENGKPEEREIQVGLSDGKWTEVTSGLQENEVAVRVDASALEKKNNSNPFSPVGGRRPPTGNSGGGGRR